MVMFGRFLWKCKVSLCGSYATAAKAAKPTSRRRILYAVSALGLAGVGGGWYMSSRKAHMHYEIPLDVVPSRTITFPSDTTGLKLTLYQYQTCPFCCKVRAFLNYYGLSYDVVEVNPVLRQQIQFSKWRKVPILIARDKSGGVQQLNDSSMIISSLQTLLLDEKQSLKEISSYYPPYSWYNEKGDLVTEVVNRYFVMYGEKPTDKSTEDLEKERKWRMWADNTLVHTISPNIYRTYNEAIESFNWFSEVGEWPKNFNALERYFVIYVGAVAMYFIGKRLQKRHHLKEDVRESIYDACREWMREVGQKPFRGGEKPDLSDLAVYGMLSAIEGCQTFDDIKKRTKIGEWYTRMKHEVDYQNKDVNRAGG